jgi:hypothetical protein
LPEDYPRASFAGRSTFEASVLNDRLISLPTDNENTNAFKHMRKNEYEEKLFKIEDERFEVDMVIDSTRTTVTVLEKLEKEIEMLAKYALMEGEETEGDEGSSTVPGEAAASASGGVALGQAASEHADNIQKVAVHAVNLRGAGCEGIAYRIDDQALSSVHKLAIG